jgi:hypothetical protein
MKIFIGVQILTTVVFTVWLLYVWIKDIDFGSQPSCNHLVKYVIFFADVRATATWLRVVFIMYLVVSACMLLFRFGAILSDHVEKLRRKIHTKGKEVWHDISHTEPHELREQEPPEQDDSDDGKIQVVNVSLSLV